MAPSLLDLPPELLFEIIGYPNGYSRARRPARDLLTLNDTCTVFRVLVRDLIPRSPELTLPHVGDYCPWSPSSDDGIDGILDTLVLADLDLDHFAGPVNNCKPCSAAAASIVTYLSNRQNPFPSLLSLCIKLPFGSLSPESDVLKLLLRAPKLRHLAIHDWWQDEPIFPPQIPARIAVEISSYDLSVKRLNCILKSVGQLRAIGSDNFEGCDGLEDQWTKDLQHITINSEDSETISASALMAVASIKRFVDVGLSLTPYVSILASSCYELEVDFVDRYLKIILQSRDLRDYSDVISIFSALFPPAKVLCVALGSYTDEHGRPVYSHGDWGINEPEMVALANALANLPDLQHIDVELNDSEKYTEHKRESWLTCATLLARASNSVTSIKLRAPLKKGASNHSLIAPFDVRRKEDVEVTFRGFQNNSRVNQSVRFEDLASDLESDLDSSPESSGN